MPGRKPKPTKLKLLQGTAQKCRMNPSEPKPVSSVPEPPSHLTAAALEEWDRITPELERLGLLSEMDMAALAGYCQNFSRWQEAEKALKASSLLIKTSNGNVIQNPLVGIANKAMHNMLKFLVEFGMTPSSRTRVSANEKQPETGFGALRIA